MEDNALVSLRVRAWKGARRAHRGSGARVKDASTSQSFDVWALNFIRVLRRGNECFSSLMSSLRRREDRRTSNSPIRFRHFSNAIISHRQGAHRYRAIISSRRRTGTRRLQSPRFIFNRRRKVHAHRACKQRLSGPLARRRSS